MTNEAAVAVYVRLDTATDALVAALSCIKGAGDEDTYVRVDAALEEALKHAAIARGLCHAVMTGGAYI